MPNVEIKCRYPDLAEAATIAVSLDGVRQWEREQTDTYFRTPHGRLKIREQGAEAAELIPYIRPDQDGPRISRYQVIPLPHPRETVALFTDMFGVDVVVRKVRTLYLIGNVRVHLDQVDGLGAFLEFEAVYEDPADENAERAKVDELMRRFHIGEADLVKGSYRELTP